MLPYVGFFESNPQGRITKDESPEARAVVKRIVDREIDKLEAGPELDALIAEKVMGCALVNHVTPAYSPTCGCENRAHRHYEERLDDLLNSFSTDMRAAWGVVEKLGDRFKWLENGFAACFAKPNDFTIVAAGDTAPLAICRAALKAVTE